MTPQYDCTYRSERHSYMPDIFSNRALSVSPVPCAYRAMHWIRKIAPSRLRRISCPTIGNLPDKFINLPCFFNNDGTLHSYISRNHQNINASNGLSAKLLQTATAKVPDEPQIEDEQSADLMDGIGWMPPLSVVAMRIIGAATASNIATSLGVAFSDNATRSLSIPLMIALRTRSSVWNAALGLTPSKPFISFRTVLPRPVSRFRSAIDQPSKPRAARNWIPVIITASTVISPSFDSMNMILRHGVKKSSISVEFYRWRGYYLTHAIDKWMAWAKKRLEGRYPFQPYLLTNSPLE